MTELNTSFSQYLESNIAPPGMDGWIASNTQTFIDAHGQDEYQMYLMSAAWSLYKKIYRSDLDLK